MYRFERRVIFPAAIFLAAGSLSQGGVLPAFPGAQGYGSGTPGGRGGRVIQVTNLEDSGPGSFGEAVNADGPRIVVFRISGTIPAAFDIQNPFITIAGQTAPGDGIAIKELKISTHDVVVRFLRIRRGETSAEDALHMEAENTIVDHCTISWGGDETVNTWHGSKNITIQWSMVSECLDFSNHAFAATLGGVNASYHHLLFAHCTARNPSIAGNNEHQTINMDFRNNVVYNFRHRTADGKPTSVNLVNNYYKPGPASTQTKLANIDDAGVYEKIPTTAWYLSGNVWDGNDAISVDNASGVTGATQWLVDEPNPFAPVATASAEQAYAMVLAGAGATLPKRDPIDARIVEEVTTGTATYGNNGIIQSPADVGGYPDLQSALPPTDSDHDGMPDAWEMENGLNPADASDGPLDRNGDGYTNVEEYLNGLVPAPVVTGTERASRPGGERRPRHPLVERVGGSLFRIRWEGIEGGLEVFDPKGRLRHRGRLENGRGAFEAAAWPPGVYCIRTGMHTLKWILLSK